MEIELIKYDAPTKVNTTVIAVRPKQQYRTSIQTIKQILEVIKNGGREGISISVLARNSRIGHKPLIEKCQKMVEAGLLNTTIGHKSRRYYITEGGIQFFALLGKYEDLMKAIR